jgi:hypothetical protein
MKQDDTIKYAGQIQSLQTKKKIIERYIYELITGTESEKGKSNVLTEERLR